MPRHVQILALLGLLIFTLQSPAEAQAVPPGQQAEAGHSKDYCDRKLGTWFYCRTDTPSEQSQEETKAPPAASSDFEAAEAFKAEMEKARLVAVWNPTEENIRTYYGYQQVTMQKSGLFADTIRRLIWADPSLDYTLTRPISAAAKSEWSDTRRTDRDLFFRATYDQIGVFYIYRGACGPCRVASPIVREFGQRFGVVVKAISTDGSANPEFPVFMKDEGQLRAWGITEPVTPAYMIFQKYSPEPITVIASDGKSLMLRPCANPKGCLTYLGAGVLTVDELADRLFTVLATEPGKDF